jgi:glycosyltransferase involved in cell wall biosynthesis
LEDLLEAVKILKNQNLGFKAWNLAIYGNGPLESKLEKLANELKIADKIEWQGFIPYSKVPEALSQIDIFVYPSWHEGFGRSIMEALAMEKAVVATRVGGIPDLIEDNENGFLVSPHNPQELAQKIKILMENKELRLKFGKAGREWAGKNFEWNDGIKKFANLFLELK